MSGESFLGPYCGANYRVTVHLFQTVICVILLVLLREISLSINFSIYNKVTFNLSDYKGLLELSNWKLTS